MTGAKRAFEILEVLGKLGEASRMELFQCFDGTLKWEFVKRAIGFLASEKLIESVPADIPGRGSIWKLTKKGESVISDWEAEQPTEEVEKP